MTLASRLTCVMVALVLGTAAAVGFLIYRNLRAAILPSELAQLSSSVQQIATKLDESVAAARNDVAATISGPVLSGILRANANSGIDPEGGIPETVWRMRLAERFAAELAAKPTYLKMRLIGAGDEGRELVRVDRFGESDRVRVVPDAELQAKGSRFFFTDAMQLNPGEVYVSPITLNQENGIIHEPHTPMLRTAAPVFTPSGERFGIVIINVDMRPLFARLTMPRHGSGSLYLINESGDFLIHPDPEKSFGFDLGKRHKLADEEPELSRLIFTTKSGHRIITDRLGHKIGVAYTHVKPAGGPGLFVIQQVPADVLLASTVAVRDTSLLAGAAAAAGAALLAWLLARSLSKPLEQTTTAVKAFAEGRTESLPTDAAGEVGVLARAFADMRSEVSGLKAGLEQRVAERTAALETANKELEAFSYSVSHDLRAPLRAVDGFSDALQSDYAADLPPEGQRYLAQIRNSAQRMGTLIDDLLRFSRLSRQPLRAELHQPAETIQKSLEDLGGLPTDRLIKLTIRDLPPVSGDPSLLKQVWINLLSNAIKYTRPRAEALIEIGAEKQGDETVFYVRDNGTGFDMKYAHKVFGVFQRLHRAEDFEGTGVGLAIVQRILHRHGGRIWCQSEPDRGTTFFFTLPPLQPPPSDEPNLRR